jgi:hypothetical protein
VLEKGRQMPAGDVAVFVDRGRQHFAAVLGIPAGIIGPAAEKGDPKGSAGDDHWLSAGSPVLFYVRLAPGFERTMKSMVFRGAKILSPISDRFAAYF